MERGKVVRLEESRGEFCSLLENIIENLLNIFNLLPYEDI